MNTNKYIQCACLDWSFDHDAQNTYRFSATHNFVEKDHVVLTVDGRSASQHGRILLVEDDGIIVQTDEWLDISEAYSIAAVSI